MERTPRWSALGGAAALLLVLVGPVQAAGVDGGITFHDIAVGGGAGITYQRTPSVTFAQRLALENTPLIPFNTFAAIQPTSPQKDHGDPGVAIFDYDNDGYLDIYVTNGPGTPNSLYHNLLGKTGKLQFEDVGVRAGVAATEQDSTGVCAGDIDNDGYADLLVVGVNGSHNHLFHNNGDGTFSDITASAGILGYGRNSSSCTMGDFDGDGLLDIYVGNTYSDWRNRTPVFLVQDYDPQLQPNELYMNRTTFSNDDDDQGHGHDRSLTVRDGHGNDDNQGNGHRRAHILFKDESAARGVNNYEGLNGDPTYTWAVAAVDYDGDGKVDLMQADSQGGMTRPGVGYNRILQNDGTGHFTDVSVERGVTQEGSWMGLSYGDYNCDGYLDFFSTNLGAFIGGPTNNSRWFLGSASKTFSDPGVGALGGTPFGWGTATLDYDNDGDQDILWYGDDDLVQFWATDNGGTLLRNSGQCSGNFAWDGQGAVLDRDNHLREVQGVAVGDLNNDGFVDIVNAATWQFTPVTSPTNRYLLWTQIFGPVFGTVFDATATLELVYRFVPASNAFTFIPTTMVNGDLSVEINSANNGNHWAKITLLGTQYLGVGRNNRDGAGALVRFTPNGGKTIIRPVIDGDSHASTSSKIVNVGMGSSLLGTVEVDWPGPNGPVRNKIYDVVASEKLLFPEIPCSYDVPGQRLSDFTRCVDKSLDKLSEGENSVFGKGPLGLLQRARFELSMLRAFRENH